MKLKLSDLPPDLRRHVLEQADLPPAAARPLPKSRPLPASPGVLVCTCGTAIFRPDGVYPETCVGCGNRRKTRQTSSME
jgi:hypothetical protein